ncbi:MAG TPA: 50S ribosomal protein L22 [Candidatus Paceibacterota bacterium]
MKTELKTYRQSPRKVRLVANLVKGRSVLEALSTLSFAQKEAGVAIHKLLRSAIANAKHNHGIEKEALFVKDIQVNPGVVLKRIMPRARGSAAQILKRTSHITLFLDTKSPDNKLKAKS